MNPSELCQMMMVSTSSRVCLFIIVVPAYSNADRCHCCCMNQKKMIPAPTNPKSQNKVDSVVN